VVIRLKTVFIKACDAAAQVIMRLDRAVN